jgi:hypothetical protein
MAGLAVSAVLDARFTGPQYGYHETDIVEATGVLNLEQIEGTDVVHVFSISGTYLFLLFLVFTFLFIIFIFLNAQICVLLGSCSLIWVLL